MEYDIRYSGDLRLIESQDLDRIVGNKTTRKFIVLMPKDEIIENEVETWKRHRINPFQIKEMRTKLEEALKYKYRYNA